MSLPFPPLLLNFPDFLETPRLLLRAPRPGDGQIVNPALRESLEELRPWLPWVSPAPTVEDSESWCRQAHARFLTREDLPFFVFLRDSNAFLGACGLHRFDWRIPRAELGYWLRSTRLGHGFITEAAGALVHFAFTTLRMVRLEIRTDDRNTRSRRVAERLGFSSEALLHAADRDPLGRLCHLRIYARLRPDAS